MPSSSRAAASALPDGLLRALARHARERVERARRRPAGIVPRFHPLIIGSRGPGM